MRFSTIKTVLVVLLVSVFVIDLVALRHHHKYGNKQGGTKFLKLRYANQLHRNVTNNNMGLWPSIFNLATKAEISVNATCGQNGREEFCRMIENGKGKCGVCDNFSAELGKRHSIHFAIDGSNRWWQSPALYYGSEYEYITIIIDLKQVYQIAYIILKAANSPRPGTWILERSIDGDLYQPWQYFVRNDKECLERFGLVATKGKPHYYTDSEVICTSFYSKLTPLENGEIHTSLIHGRPGANETSPELLEFTKARYVRLRLMGLRGTMEPLPRWFTQDIWKDKRLFYSIRDISIGGQCVCNGHAENCRHNVASGHPECECSHNTCGSNCDKCCPMFNQRQWGPGTSRDARQCLPCNCHGHASSCHYDEDVDRTGLSMDISGNYQGGGVCDNCTDYTTGINCEQCINGYFRPHGVLPDAKQPCLKCDCDPIGSKEGSCIQYGETAGTCQCLTGYTGPKCDICMDGYRGYPNCEPCPCDPKGVIEIGDCEGECKCKNFVDGKYCDHCKPGHFGLRHNLINGCLPCICSGMTTLCESALINSFQIQTLEDWFITDLKVTHLIKPTYNGQSVFSVGNYELPGVESLYWIAPKQYLGNKLQIYNGDFRFKVQSIVMRGDTSGEPTKGPNIVLVGVNGLHLAYGDDVYTATKMTFDIKLNEYDWYVIPNHIKDITTRLRTSDYRLSNVTRKQFLSVLADIKYILLRGTFHTDQIEGLLEEAIINVVEEEDGYGSVEKCSCPSGYTGLSCESCAFGYVRIVANNSDNEEQSFCGKCDCNGHSETCNPNTGECFCQHNTIGEKCERCAPGYYGNPFHGTPNDCKKCACPLENDGNNFSPSCQLEFFAEDTEKYVCTQCPNGYTGDHCEICDDGFYGDPLTIGGQCISCDCGGGPCDPKTGQCLSCKGNTEGWKCERCKPEHYGNASTLNCKACECDPIGSISKQCDNVTGQCLCKERFIGRTCNQCENGYGNVTALCQKCVCSPIGSKSQICDAHSGICDCLDGVEGFHCDTCQNLYYGFSEDGCKPCTCSPIGSKVPQCNVTTGRCMCRENFTGRICDKCLVGYYQIGNNCTRCNCSLYGSRNNVCDEKTGQCSCKPGYGGLNCDKCLPNYYRSSQNECKKCDDCSKLSGHICSPIDGSCICPKNVEGSNCDKCVAGAWGYEPEIGCKKCNCRIEGSENGGQCDQISGQCSCKPGFKNDKCSECTSDHYGPYCKPCNCDNHGTIPEKLSICGNDGQCECKENVQGRTCNKCKIGTFALSTRSDKSKDKGCIKCFCFQRQKNSVNECGQADVAENPIRIRSELEVTESCDYSPYCWTLPNKFRGDLISFYNGQLRIENVHYRAIILNKRTKSFIIESKFVMGDIQLIESEWHLRDDSDTNTFCQHHNSLTRECFLIILQHVDQIFILFENTTQSKLIRDVVLKPSSGPITDVEECNCPTEYTGLSCQNPNKGYFRSFENTENEIEKIVGVAKKCNCNGRSNNCDPETGHCIGCSDHTTGEHCQLCEEGYYLNNNKCLPCLCPNENHNNAIGCIPDKNEYKCTCKPGYTGKKCQQCNENYYSNPLNSFECFPCNCNIFGSEHGGCDKKGKCKCKEGFTGKKCDKCLEQRHFLENGRCTACDECSQLLFKDIDDMKTTINLATDLFKQELNPPWIEFTKYADKKNNLDNRFQTKLDKIYKLLQNNEISKLTNKVELIQKELHSHDSKENLYEKIEMLHEESANMLKDVRKERDKLNTIINELDNTGRQHINNQKALQTALRMLKQMDNFERKIGRNWPEITRCKLLEKRIHEIYNLESKIVPTRKLMDVLREQLRNKETYLDFVTNETIFLEQNNEKNKDRIEKLKMSIEKINKINNDSLQTEKYLQLIKNYSETSAHLSEKLRNFNYSLLTQLDAETDNKININVDDIIDYVEDLEETVEDLFTTFNYNKINNATTAYQDIVKGIKYINETIHKNRAKLNEINKLFNGTQNETISIKALLLHAKSDRLLKRSANIKRNTRLSLIDTNIDNTKGKLYESGKRNNKLLQKIQMAKNDAVDWSAILKNISSIDDIRRIQRDLNTLNITSQYDLHKHIQKYREIQSDTERAKFNEQNEDLIEKLKEVNGDIRYRIEKIEEHDKTFNQSRIDLIRNKIMDLKNKILYGRQIANEVNVAMRLNNCLRKYQIPNPLVLWKKLEIKFKCKNYCALFKSTNEIKNKTITLFVETIAKKSKVRVSLNEREILSLKLTDNSENNVRVEFQNNVVGLILDNPKNGRRIERTIVEDIFYTPSIIQVGSIDKIQDGYISHLQVNEDKIGLWNFIENNGNCTSEETSEETSSEKSDDVYFAKDAYKIYKSSNLNVKEFGMTFTFATFDENSMIYLAQDTTNLSSFIALRLSDGLVKLHVRHIDGTEVLLSTENKYNNGETNKAVIGMQYNGTFEKYNLTVNNEQKFYETKLTNKYVFKIKRSHHYIGGVNPTFDKTYLPFNIPYSFKGILKHSTGLESLSMKNGVEREHDLQYTKAWFNGNGYLKLVAYNKIPFENIRFALRPLNSSSAIVNITNLGIIYLKNDHIEFKNGQNTFIMNNSINKNNYNYVRINKTHMIVNNEDLKIGHLNLDITEMNFGRSEELLSYSGGVADIFVNNLPFYLNKSTIKHLEHVEIGREKPFAEHAEFKMLSPPETTNSMQNTEGCAPISHYITDERAVKFGDKPNSFVYINTPFWKRDFKFKFDFRTFYPDGLLIISTATAKNNFNFLQLQKGKIQLYIKGRKKKTLFNNEIVNDGLWHTLQISTVTNNVNKKKRKLTVILDNNRSRLVNIPRNTIRGDIYLGGVSEDFTNFIELKNNLLPFRGCMKMVEINDIEQEIIKNSNIGQCFPNVEEGAYFSGDAYAIYKRSFQVNNILELGFQFRTAEQNGVLLSVSNPKNSPALSVELQNGAVVMTVDMGNGIISKVTNNLDSEFALCNNKWHNVTAFYSNSELTVNIDGITKTWVQSDINSLMDEIDAPLFIGGLPDDAPIGTLKTRENFKGCIRNLNIERIVMDWTDMEDLSNILLNSCPLS